MLSLSFDGGCICARDYAITQAMFYLSLILNKNVAFVVSKSRVESVQNRTYDNRVNQI